MYANVRGLKGKKTGISEIVQQHEPHIFLVAETQLRSDLTESFTGYTFFHRKREGKVGGGVGILVKNNFRHNIALHISDRPLEIMWLSVFRNNERPLFIGVYYGRQESRTSKEETEREMTLLSEEIAERESDGEILLAMDGNARIGLLGEPVSRNGKCLLDVFKNFNLRLMNNTEKCRGKITRVNTKNEREFSAIDFVLVSEAAEPWVKNMIIDEDGLLKVKGRNQSDHNTIVIDMHINGTCYAKTEKRTCWNINAPEHKWNSFTSEVNKRYNKAKAIISDPSMSVDTKYKKWYNELENAARLTIGKTTVKDLRDKPSPAIKQFNHQKKELKAEIHTQQDATEKKKMIAEYKELQERTKEQLVKEKSEKIKERFEKMVNEPSRHTFWKEKKKVTRDPAAESIIIKDHTGKRHFEPNAIKENIATYYENLYKNKGYHHHPYHDDIERKTISYLNNFEYENEYYNTMPSFNEIKRIIEQKKNGKSTTDIKNEMLKRSGENMVNFLQPLIATIWREENIPSAWNKGHITSLYKGKGDKEMLTNYRPITTSSAIGTIIEAAIDRRIENIVSVTQAQGGGQRKSSTFDHLFLLRAVIDLSKKQKTPTFLTFYDVSKAYDHANNDDMLSIVWERGLRGKVWRILRNLCNNLHASVKTRFGPTRDFSMEIGGRQGSRITGRLFSKMMDVLSEELQPTGMGFHLSEELRLVVLLWVDDVLSFAIGEEEQEEILKKIDEFALKHKLQWGHSKCNIMKVGVHDKKQNQKTWHLGTMQIHESTTYRYLGDIISNDGKYTKNIESRKVKTQATTININSIASTEIMRKMETSVLLELHDKITIPGLLANAESWSLLKTETTEMEKIEYQALRNLFDLPLHTPIPGIIFSLGTLYTHLRIEMRRLMYLHRLLNRQNTNWTKQTFHILEEQNIGWAKTIKNTLRTFDLPTDFNIIRDKRPNEWKRLVNEKIEARNKARLIEECHKMAEGQRIRKTKTSFIVDLISADTYIRGPSPEFQSLTKQETKTAIISRFRMLECGANFKNSSSIMCPVCKTRDNEDHRLNHCVRFKTTNYFDHAEKVNFDDVYSTNSNVLKNVIEKIESVWNTRNAHGSMLQ